MVAHDLLFKIIVYLNDILQDRKAQLLLLLLLCQKILTLGEYDRILSNVGGAYHLSTGTFTAPFKGVYSISCCLMSDPSNSIHLQITKNGSKLSILYSASSTHPHAGQTLQLLLNKGDKIWIQNVNSVVAKLNDHGSYNLFSGALITKL